MSMKLLPEKPGSASYFPVSFSGNQSLVWTNGATLGQEYLINFDRDC